MNTDEEEGSASHKHRGINDMEAGDSKMEGRRDSYNKGGSVDGGNSQTLDAMMMEEEEAVVEQTKMKKKTDTMTLKPTFDNGLDMISSDEYIRVSR